MPRILVLAPLSLTVKTTALFGQAPSPAVKPITMEGHAGQLSYEAGNEVEVHISTDAKTISAETALVRSERTDQAFQRLAKGVIAKQPQSVTIMSGTNDSYVDKGAKDGRLTEDDYRQHRERSACRETAI
jgi:hypothetical protein